MTAPIETHLLISLSSRSAPAVFPYHYSGLPISNFGIRQQFSSNTAT